MDFEAAVDVEASSATLLPFLWRCCERFNDVGDVGLNGTSCSEKAVALTVDTTVEIVDELNARSSSRENGFRGGRNFAGELERGNFNLEQPWRDPEALKK